MIPRYDDPRPDDSPQASAAPNDPQDCAGRRARARSRAQAAPLGVVLVIALVVLGVGVVVTTGTATLDDAKQNADVALAQHALSELDAKSTRVGLRGAPGQSVDLGASGDGRYAVDPDAGWLRVVHSNYTTGETEVIHNRTLGAVTYHTDGTTLAYQGGGVWRRDGDASTMVSPPEIHYQAATLVMPVIRVSGSGAASGRVRARVAPGAESERVFPDADGDSPAGPGAPYDATGAAYRNPIQGGDVEITVHSAYYEAWGRFFAARTAGEVTYDHANETVTLELVAPRTIGDFEMPDEGNAVDVRGLESGHGLDEFTVSLVPDDSDAAEFSNLQWSLYVERGAQEFELHLRLYGPDDDPATACKEQDVSATVYYSGHNGDPYQGWYEPTAFHTTCYDADDDGVDDEVRLDANFTGTTTLSMTDLESDDLNRFSPGGHTRETSVTFDAHADDVDWEPTTFDGTDATTIGRLTRHYLALLGPNFDLVVDDKNSDTVLESGSHGTLYYESDGRVTYMHITDDGVRVDVSG